MRCLQNAKQTCIALLQQVWINKSLVGELKAFDPWSLPTPIKPPDDKCAIGCVLQYHPAMYRGLEVSYGASMTAGHIRFPTE